MSTLVISDTYEVIKQLEKKGFSKNQAEGITDALKKAELQDIATKSFVKDEIHKLTVTLFAFMLAQSALIVALIQFFDK